MRTPASGGGTQGSGGGTKAPKGTAGGHPGGPRWPQVGLQGRDPGVWVALGGLQWLKTPRCLGAGNEALHALTAAGPTELRVDLRTPLDAAFAHYRDFAVAGPEEHYRLHLGAYSGTAGARGSWPVNGPSVFGGGYWGVPMGIGRALGEGCWPMGRVLGSPVGISGVSWPWGFPKAGLGGVL